MKEYMEILAEIEKLTAEIERTQIEKVSDVVRTLSGEYVFVDTCYTLDHGYETMVFKSDSEGNVSNWSELDQELYDTWSDALKGHSDMRSKWAERR